MTSDRLTRVVQLLPTTAETEAGPLIEHRLGLAVVRYDGEDEAGMSRWTTLRFVGAIALRFTPEVACDRLMIEAYSRVCEVQDSTWLSELSERAADQRASLPELVRHLVVYFDHAGCLEVLAVEVLVEAG